MMTRLREMDPVRSDQVDLSVLLCDPSRPDTRPKSLERLRLAFSHKRIAHDGVDEMKNAQGHFSILFDPVTKVFPK